MILTFNRGGISTRALTAAVFFTVSVSGCATGGAPTPADVAENILARTGANVRLGGAEAPAIPADIQVADGLSRDEAVAIARPERRGSIARHASGARRGGALRRAPDLLKRALAARPDLRAAELTVEAAAARLGWEDSRILTLTAVLDANGEGKEGFE